MAAALLSGGLLFASFPSLNWNLLTWIATAPLLAALVCETRLSRAFILAHLCGAVFMGGSCHWFTDVLEIHGGLSPPLAWFALFLFLLVYCVIFGLFGVAVCWVAQESRSLALLLSPFLWVALELGRTYWMTGFPWNLLGYGVAAPGLRQWASVTGVYGLSFLASTTSMLLIWLLLGRRHKVFRFGAAAWFLALILGNWLSAPPPLAPGSIRAHLVQPNVPLDAEGAARWAPWHDAAPLEGLVAMSIASVSRHTASQGPASLVIWPENPAPFYFERDPVFRNAVERMARATHAYVVVGTVNYTGAAEQEPTNTAVVLDPDGRVVLMYDKIHLVPFGEYVPSWALPGLVGKITHEAGNFVPGSEYRAARTPRGTLAVFICYEAIFPQLVRRLTPEEPGVLVNISNDAWFGDTAAPLQHLQMARLRAIEMGRYLLRSTNDGVTCVIDPYGRILHELPRHQLGVLAGSFDYRGGRTFYGAHGDVFAWLCVTVAVGLMGYRALAIAAKRRARV